MKKITLLCLLISNSICAGGFSTEENEYMGEHYIERFSCCLAFFFGYGCRETYEVRRKSNDSYYCCSNLCMEGSVYAFTGEKKGDEFLVQKESLKGQTLTRNTAALIATTFGVKAVEVQ